MDNTNAATTRTTPELEIHHRATRRTPGISNTILALSSSSSSEEDSSTSISKENEDGTKKKFDEDDTDAVLLASGTELTKQMMMKNKNKDDENDENDNNNPLLQIGNALKPLNDLVDLILGSPYSAPFLFLLPILGNRKVRYAIASAFGVHDN